MKRFKLIVALAVVSVFGLQTSLAQSARDSRPDKKEWLAKMRKVKHEFITKELQLTDAQKSDFFEIYDRSESAKRKIESDVRKREKAIMQKGDAATDADLDSLIADQFSLEERLSAIDRSSLPQLRKVLTRRQLARLKHAERKFNRKLMEQRAGANCTTPAKPSQK